MIDRLRLWQIVIISIINFYSVSFVFASNPRMAKAFRSKAGIEYISSAIELFKQDLGKYPPQNMGLSSLYKIPPGEKFQKWNGPYLDNKHCRIMTDGWGNNYVYRNPGIYNIKSYDLYSLGEDSKSASEGNDDDDINNWNPKDTWKDYYKLRIPIGIKFLIVTILCVLIYSLKIIGKLVTKLIARSAKIKSATKEIPVSIAIFSIISLMYIKNDFSTINETFILIIFLIIGILFYNKYFDKGRNIHQTIEIASFSMLLFLLMEMFFHNFIE